MSEDIDYSNHENLIPLLNYIGEDWENKQFLPENQYLKETYDECVEYFNILKKDVKLLKKFDKHTDIENYFRTPSGSDVLDGILYNSNGGSLQNYLSLIDSRIGILMNKLNKDEELDYIKIKKEDNTCYLVLPKGTSEKIQKSYEKWCNKPNHMFQ